MKQIVRITSLVLLALLVFVPFQAAAAKGSSFDGQVIFGQSYTLKNGESLMATCWSLVVRLRLKRVQL